MTKEHLWPASLHKRLLVANQQTTHHFWLARLQKELPNEPQIRDVCAYCNNTVLSELDAYICKLFDTTFAHIPKRYSKVAFEHDYHLLKRWLLKMCFNSARIHNSFDLFVLQTLSPYILGKNNSLGKSVQLYLQLSYPEEMPRDETDKESIHIFEPTIHRAGHMLFRLHGIGEKIVRAVHLRSFSFYLAFFEPEKPRVQQDYFAQAFCSSLKETTLLRPSRPSIFIECNGIGAWESYKRSRSTQFEFKNQNTKE